MDSLRSPHVRHSTFHTEQPQTADPELDAVVRLIIGIIHRAHLDAMPQRRTQRPPAPHEERQQVEAQQFLDWIKDTWS